MRALFVVSDGDWSARARAFVLAARGLLARRHDVVLACASECPVQVRAAASAVPVFPLHSVASATGSTMQIRRALKEQSSPFDAIFVHTDRELLRVGSALRLGGGASQVIRRIPPFTTFVEGRRARLARRLAPTGLLFSTDADRAHADLAHLPVFVAPLGVDPHDHDGVPEAKAALGASSNATTIVCLHDGEDRRKVLIALRTIALLKARHPELHLVVVGGSSQEELRMEGAALGINKRVTYLGMRGDELSILRAADVGWIAADADAGAFAALDFMSFGIPVIAEKDSLTEHYIADGIAGILLPRAESMAEMTTIAAMISAFIAKEDQRVAMGKAARARVEREFPYEPMIQGFEEAASPGSRTGRQTVA